MTRAYKPWQLLLLFAAAAGLTGCAGGILQPSQLNPAAVALTGKIRGGHQPISGASISLYAAGTTAPGGGAIDLLAGKNILTDAYGGFTITGDYTCPSASSQVYLVSRGGNPGLSPGTYNNAITLVSALGDCGALTSSTFIFVNEVTTAASAWALAQFLSPGALVNASPGNATGLRNAFLAAANLADTTSGQAPGRSLPFGALVETRKLNTLANILAACVNSDGSGPCTTLFSAAAVGGSAPSNTLDAAVNIVRHPAANVAAGFALAPPQPPFQPTLTSAPNDWTLSVTYGECTSGCGGLNLPTAVAVDSTGSVWVANVYGGAVSKFSPAGLPAAPNGLPGLGLASSYGIAIDAQDSVWIANQQSVSAAGNSRVGSISHFSNAGTELTGFGITGGGIYYPQSVAATQDGQIWIADYGDSSASLLSSIGGTLPGVSGYATGALPFTSSVAVDSAQQGWFAVQGGVAVVTRSNAVRKYSCCNNPAGIALDQAGNIWVADYGSSAVTELSSTGVILGRVSGSGGLATPQTIAVDGAGTVWTTNYHGNSLSQISPATMTSLSPSTGLGADAMLDEPFGLAIDASGNLWVSNAASSTLTQFVGAAAPLKTSLVGLPVQP